jgi:hypothetical protein
VRDVRDVSMEEGARGGRGKAKIQEAFLHIVKASTPSIGGLGVPEGEKSDGGAKPRQVEREAYLGIGLKGERDGT